MRAACARTFALPELSTSKLQRLVCQVLADMGLEPEEEVLEIEALRLLSRARDRLRHSEPQRPAEWLGDRPPLWGEVLSPRAPPPPR